MELSYRLYSTLTVPCFCYLILLCSSLLVSKTFECAFLILHLQAHISAVRLLDLLSVCLDESNSHSCLF